MSKTSKGFKKTSGMVEVVLHWNDAYQATTLKVASGLALTPPSKPCICVVPNIPLIILYHVVDDHLCSANACVLIIGSFSAPKRSYSTTKFGWIEVYY